MHCVMNSFKHFIECNKLRINCYSLKLFSGKRIFVYVNKVLRKRRRKRNDRLRQISRPDYLIFPTELSSKNYIHNLGYHGKPQVCLPSLPKHPHITCGVTCTFFWCYTYCPFGSVETSFLISRPSSGDSIIYFSWSEFFEQYFNRPKIPTHIGFNYDWISTGRSFVSLLSDN